MINENIITALRKHNSSTTQAVANDLKKFNAIVLVDAEMAVVRLRRALDHVIRSTAILCDIVPGTKPLEQIIDELTHKRILPGIIVKHCRVIKDFGNLAAHGDSAKLFNDEGNELTSVEAQMCAGSIEIILRWYIDQIAPKLFEENPYNVVSEDKITTDMIRQTTEIDALIYPDSFRGVYDKCCLWFERNPHIYTIIIDALTQQVVGYINAMPLEHDAYLTVENGSILDVDIHPQSIRRYDLPDFYQLYFASIGIHPSYHNTAAFRALYDAFINKLVQLARNDVFVSEIMADAITNEGVRLCRYAGMREHKATPHGSKIFKLTLMPPSLRVRTMAGKTLLNFYSSKYEEFRDLL